MNHNEEHASEVLTCGECLNFLKAENNWKQRTSDAPKVFNTDNRRLTLDTIKDADKGIGLSESFDNAEDMMGALNADEEVDREDVGAEIIKL